MFSTQCKINGNTPSPVGAKLAREKPKNTTGHLVTRVTVHDHREQARSYNTWA